MATAQEEMNTSDAGQNEAGQSELIGLMAQFDDPDTLVEACDSARQFGYKKMDAYSPFPVHGIDEAIGIRRTILPFVVLGVGLAASMGALGLQWYANATDWVPPFPGYKYIISGKPFFSWPANIPVTFELIVLSSAFASFLGMLAMNGLPRFANPLHRISRFKRVTNDRFFLVIDKDDDKFNESEIRGQFEDWGTTGIEEVRRDLTDHEIPQVLKRAGVLIALLLILPPIMIYRARGMTSRSPRLHVVPDMDWQYKFKPQNVGPNFAEGKEDNYFFNDIRVMREPIAGTIARGDLQDDPEFFLGYVPKPVAVKANAWVGPRQEESEQEDPKAESEKTSEAGKQDENEAKDDAAKPENDAAPEATQENNDKQDDSKSDGNQSGGEAAKAPEVPEPDWVTEFPEQVKIDKATIERGRARFEIYCVVCHGYAGDGDGLVNKRAMELNLSSKATWTQAKSFHDPEVMKQPVGRIFDTISNGRGTMGPYQSQISAADRWAIVLYIKALQETRANEKKPDPPEEEKDADAKDTEKKDAANGGG